MGEAFLDIFRMLFSSVSAFYEKIDQYELLPNVSVIDLMVGFLIIGFVVTMFWKGAKA